MREAVRLDPRNEEFVSDLKYLEDGLRAAKAREKRAK